MLGADLDKQVRVLGADLDKQVRAYITELRLRDGVVNTAVVIAAGMGIVKSYDANICCRAMVVVLT